MSLPMDAAAVLDRHFLEVRARLLEIAATLDRLDRAPGESKSDRRYLEIVSAIEFLASQNVDVAAADRAEHLQRLFSRHYDSQWRETMNV